MQIYPWDNLYYLWEFDILKLTWWRTAFVQQTEIDVTYLLNPLHKAAIVSLHMGLSFTAPHVKSPEFSSVVTDFRQVVFGRSNWYEEKRNEGLRVLYLQTLSGIYMLHRYWWEHVHAKIGGLKKTYLRTFLTEWQRGTNRIDIQTPSF